MESVQKVSFVLKLMRGESGLSLLMHDFMNAALSHVIITKPYDFSFTALISGRGKMIPSDLERRIVEAKQKVISMTVSPGVSLESV